MPATLSPVPDDVIPELAHLARDVRHGDCVAGDVRAEHGWYNARVSGRVRMTRQNVVQ
jgi:hypothetical protein